MDDPGTFTGLGKEGMRRRLESLASWGMVLFSFVLVLLLFLAWIFS